MGWQCYRCGGVRLSGRVLSECLALGLSSGTRRSGRDLPPPDTARPGHFQCELPLCPSLAEEMSQFLFNALHMLPCSPLAGLGPHCPTPPDLSALPHLSIPLLRSPTPAWQCCEENHPSGGRYQTAAGLTEMLSWCIPAFTSATCRCHISQPDAAPGCHLPWATGVSGRHGEAIERLLAGGQGCFSKPGGQ